MDREHLDWENDIVEQRVLRKSCSHNGVGCPEHLTHCKKDPMSSLTPSPDCVLECLAKAVCTMDLGILSIHPPLRKGPFALEVDVLLVSLNTKFLTRKKKVVNIGRCTPN